MTEHPEPSKRPRSSRSLFNRWGAPPRREQDPYAITAPIDVTDPDVRRARQQERDYWCNRGVVPRQWGEEGTS